MSGSDGDCISDKDALNQLSQIIHDVKIAEQIARGGKSRPVGNPVKATAISDTPEQHPDMSKDYEPYDGEVRFGIDCGYTSKHLKSRRYAWFPCDKCHERRWVKLINKKLAHHRHLRCPREDKDLESKEAGQTIGPADGLNYLRKSKKGPPKNAVQWLGNE